MNEKKTFSLKRKDKRIIKSWLIRRLWLILLATSIDSISLYNKYFINLKQLRQIWTLNFDMPAAFPPSWLAWNVYYIIPTPCITGCNLQVTFNIYKLLDSPPPFLIGKASAATSIVTALKWLIHALIGL